MDLVSIIIPVYKVERYLRSCIDSVRNQTYRSLEIIIVDDGSPDKCGEICDDYAKKDNRIQVIHKQNSGLGMARNSGLEVATGKYVLFVDSDDWIETNMVEMLVRAAQEYSAEMIICGYKIFSQSGITKECPVCSDIEKYEGTEQIVQRILAPIVGPKRINGAEDLQEMCVWTNLYSMDIISQYNIRFVNEREYLSEDLSFNISYITKAKTAVRIPELLYCYRYNETSLSNIYRPNRITLLNNLIEHTTELLRGEGLLDILSDRLKRTYVMKLRHGLLHISQTKLMSKDKRALYMNAVRSERVQATLEDYPINMVPLKERIFVILIKKYQVSLLYVYLNLQLLFLNFRQWVYALRK